MLKKLIVALIGLFLLVGVFVTGVVVGELDMQSVPAKTVQVIAPTPKPLSSSVLWDMVQNWREVNNKKKYINNDFLCDLAKVRVYEIKSDWSHSGFEERYSGKDNIWIHTQFKFLGENLAKDMESESLTLTGWLNSPKHRENLDKNFTHSCIVTDGGYAVQIFANY